MKKLFVVLLGVLCFVSTPFFVCANQQVRLFVTVELRHKGLSCVTPEQWGEFVTSNGTKHAELINQCKAGSEVRALLKLSNYAGELSVQQDGDYMVTSFVLPVAEAKKFEANALFELVRQQSKDLNSRSIYLNRADLEQARKMFGLLQSAVEPESYIGVLAALFV